MEFSFFVLSVKVFGFGLPHRASPATATRPRYFLGAWFRLLPFCNFRPHRFPDPAITCKRACLSCLASIHFSNNLNSVNYYTSKPVYCQRKNPEKPHFRQKNSKTGVFGSKTGTFFAKFVKKSGKNFLRKQFPTNFPIIVVTVRPI